MGNNSNPTLKPSGNATATDSINSIRGGGQVSFDINEIDQESNGVQFFEWLIQNKNKLLFIGICGTMIFLCFRKRKFLKDFLKKFWRFFVKIKLLTKKISSCRIINNRLTKGIFLFWPYTNPYAN